MRCPCAAEATSCFWCGIRATPGVRAASGAGSVMQAVAPPPTYSKDLKRGSSSSQLASRRSRGRCSSAAEKSGTRNGLASRRAMTDCGTTRRGEEVAAVSGLGGSSSSGASMPACLSIWRRSARAPSETSASSASSCSSEVSRAAVLARMVAMPSRRLSCSPRRPSATSVSALIRERSSRTSSATTWKVARPWGITLPRSAACSTSRTARASTGMMPSLSSRLTLVLPPRRCAVWRRPR